MYRSKTVVFWLFVSLALGQLLVGCSGGAKTAASGTTGAPGSTAGTETPPQKGVVSKPQLQDVPAELRHDAFAYYGLNNSQPVDMEAREGAIASTGARISRLVEVADGKAIFETEYTGGLANLGTERISIEPDGAYTIDISIGEMTPERSLTLPASLTAGKSWQQNTTVEQPGGAKLVTNQTHKVVGQEKVKTKAGEFDSILVVATGTMDQNGQKSDVQMKYWLVKDVGPVKMEVTSKGGPQPKTVVIEATTVNK